MKKILFICFAAMLLSLGAFAKTYSYDLIPPENLEYTLAEHEDALKCTVYIEENGILGVGVKSVSTLGDFPPSITVSLLHKGNEIVSFSTKDEGFDPNKYHIIEGLAEGEYILKIVNNTKFSDVTFALETTFTPHNNVESQKGKGRENATQMEFSQKYLGGVMLSDTSDIYCFTMKKDGYAVIDMYSSELKYFTLSDSDGNEIGTMEIKLSDPKFVFETRCGLKKGTYYITVTPEEDYLSPLYSIEVFDYYDAEFEQEYNNISSSATAITSGKEVRGNLFGYDDIDFYSFTLDKKSNVKATLTDKYLNNDDHYSFALYDSSMNEIESREYCSTFSFEKELDKGEYLLSVSCSNTKYFTPFGYSVTLKTTALPSQSQDGTENGTDSNDTDSNNTDGNNTGIEKEHDTPAVDNSTEEITQFDDIQKDDWFAQDILTARKKGLIDGTGSNIFHPFGNVTVAEAVTMASRMYEKHFGTAITALDSSEKWYSQYVMYAIAAGIINPEDFDDYERNATRAEMAYIFGGVMKKTELPAMLTYEVYIPDVDIKDKYFNEIQLLYKLDILTGVDDIGTFLPENNVTRAESAVIMLRCAQFLGI